MRRCSRFAIWQYSSRSAREPVQIANILAQNRLEGA
jgi:hypothetical protein